MSPHRIELVSLEEGNLDTQGEDSHVNTKAETGIKLPHDKECLGPPEAGRGKEGDSRKLWRQCGPANTLVSNFQPLEPSVNKFLLL